MIDATALSEKPVLTGARIRLAPLSIRHAAAFHAACLDPETRRLTGTHHDFTREEIRGLVRPAVPTARTGWISRSRTGKPGPSWANSP